MKSVESLLNRLENFERRLGYKFTDRSLLINALTHSSFANEQYSQNFPSNERLEFLGDSVLGLIIAEYLYKAHDDSEGELTAAKNYLVSGTCLSQIAEKVKIGDYLLLSSGEENSLGRKKASMLEDALEAVIGAIYLDKDLDSAAKVVLNLYGNLLVQFKPEELKKRDYKSYLQELFQAEKISPPDYEVIEESGPDHDKTFTSSLVSNEKELSRGLGKSKKAAEQEAAKLLLEKIDKENLSLKEIINN